MWAVESDPGRGNDIGKNPYDVKMLKEKWKGYFIIKCELRGKK